LAKGSVENLVGWVKGSFFKQRRFVDDDDLLQQLAEWRTEVNTQRPCRATNVIPVVRLEEERPRLRPLKVAPADLAVRVPIVVGVTGEVIHDLHPYSMPACCRRFEIGPFRRRGIGPGRPVGPAGRSSITAEDLVKLQ
jgi:hypothetical protein